MDRRSALKLIGGAAAGITLSPRMLATPAPSSKYPLVPVRSLYGAMRARPAVSAPSLAFQVLRTTDMVYLGFEFYNAKAVVTAGQTEIVAEDTTLPMVMVVVFPSQHLGEECVAYSTSLTTWPSPPLNGALAGFTWLAFDLPGTETIPYTIAGLLNWAKAKPSLVPAAAAAGSPAPPDPLHTALEIPWQLWLTPLPHGTWHHATDPVVAKQITELWHTRLGAGALEPPVVSPKLKAFWAPGYPGAFAPRPRTHGSCRWNRRTASTS